jgi:hypothetical protein
VENLKAKIDRGTGDQDKVVYWCIEVFCYANRHQFNIPLFQLHRQLEQAIVDCHNAKVNEIVDGLARSYK